MPQNKKKVILERRSRVAELYLRGVAQYKIAEELNVTSGLISQDLKKLSEQWQASINENIDKIKAREMEKINNLERQYHDAWIRSCEVKTKKSAKKKGLTNKTGQSLGIDSKEQTFTEEQQIGDPRFLEGVRWCITKREEIFGYGAAKKIDLSSKGEKLQGGSVIILPSNGREVIESVPDSSKSVPENG
jgi:predicted transcriptional regulator